MYKTVEKWQYGYALKIYNLNHCAYNHKLLYKTAKRLVVTTMLNKNTWGVKKVRGQEEPATKNSDIK